MARHQRPPAEFLYLFIVPPLPPAELLESFARR
jgi:hypothetical protein